MYRILIVEDDPVITETLCAYMGRWGMEARGVEDFQNVLREFAAFDPQLVLMDISLPFFDGYHWCAEIRKISTAPILFISSAGDNLNILRALDAGAEPGMLQCHLELFGREGHGRAVRIDDICSVLRGLFSSLLPA